MVSVHGILEILEISHTKPLAYYFTKYWNALANISQKFPTVHVRHCSPWSRLLSSHCFFHLALYNNRIQYASICEGRSLEYKMSEFLDSRNQPGPPSHCFGDGMDKCASDGRASSLSASLAWNRCLYPWSLPASLTCESPDPQYVQSRENRHRAGHFWL